MHAFDLCVDWTYIDTFVGEFGIEDWRWWHLYLEDIEFVFATDGPVIFSLVRAFMFLLKTGLFSITIFSFRFLASA